MAFHRILIANRGEIALRVIRACRDLGIESTVVYSEADRGALYLEHADNAICIGPGPSPQSYLNIQSIISAAEQADVEAIHPGYGFLSENPSFAEICESCRIEFIGPKSETIARMGDKGQARLAAMENDVPTVPGSKEAVGDEREALEIAHSLGYPVIIKAVAGGGGRGMRVAHNDASFASNFYAARREAEAAFNNGDVYLERYLERPRHIEFQILGDKHGNVVHLGERDCSLQRRHQKVVEEAPSPALDDDLRKRMGEAAVRLAKAVGYYNAGTIEFLLDQQGNFYFIEMNTRLQVEHPVTEAITGIDIVREQIRIAQGEELGYTQDDIKLEGWAIECRINAEDPDSGFKPDPGLITDFYAPGGPGIRLDSHAHAGYTVPPTYDSMIGKLIGQGSTREEAINVLKRALHEFRIGGIKTTIPLHQRILEHSHFLTSDVDTGWLETVGLSG